jgi:hypothetical protein
MVLSEGTTEKIPSDTTGDRSLDRPTNSAAIFQHKYNHSPENGSTISSLNVSVILVPNLKQNLLFQ